MKGRSRSRFLAEGRAHCRPVQLRPGATFKEVNMGKTLTIAEIMIQLSDQELLEALPYVRNADGEKMSLIELKHCLRETVKEVRDARG